MRSLPTLAGIQQAAARECGVALEIMREPTRASSR